MKINIIYAIMLMLISANVYLLMTRKKNTLQFINKENDIKKLQVYNTVSNNMLFNTGQFVDIQLAPNAVLTNEDGKQEKIKDILGQRKVLFRFDETSCFACVEHLIPHLKSLEKKIGNNILIVGSFYSAPDLFLTLERFKLNIPVYNMNPQQLKTLNRRLSAFNVPYIFILDGSYQTSHFFIPEKGMPELTSTYFNKLQTLFNQ